MKDTHLAEPFSKTNAVRVDPASPQKSDCYQDHWIKHSPAMHSDRNKTFLTERQFICNTILNPYYCGLPLGEVHTRSLVLFVDVWNCLDVSLKEIFQSKCNF